ncbi:MAG: PIN domain-containing protein [Chthoniobacterales bacterium]
MNTSPEPGPAMNHVFVDCENVPTVDPSVIGAKTVSFILLLGARQTKLDVALVEKLMEHAACVQLIRLTTSGRNALDFALAYYLGRAVLSDPTGYFHIVSKDTGFDPLVEHLKSRHVRAMRHDDFATLTFCYVPKAAPVAAPTPMEDPLARVLAQLRKNVNSRPKRKKTLMSQLLSLLKPTTEETVEKLIEKLQKQKHLTIDAKGAVEYSLSKS